MKKEIKEITGIDLSENSEDPYLTDYTRRISMFHSLLKYRVQVEEIRKAFSGVMGYPSFSAQKIRQMIIEDMAD